MKSKIKFTLWMRDFKRIHFVTLLGPQEAWKRYKYDSNINRMMINEMVWLIAQDMPFSREQVYQAWRAAIATYRDQAWYARLWAWTFDK